MIRLFSTTRSKNDDKKASVNYSKVFSCRYVAKRLSALLTRDHSNMLLLNFKKAWHRFHKTDDYIIMNLEDVLPPIEDTY